MPANFLKALVVSDSKALFHAMSNRLPAALAWRASRLTLAGRPVPDAGWGNVLFPRRHFRPAQPRFPAFCLVLH